MLRPCSTLGISDLRVDQEIDELQHHHHQAYHRQLHGDLPPALANPSERPPPIRPTPVVGYPLCVRGVDLSDHASSRFAEQIQLANNNRELFHQQLPTVLHLNGGAMLSSITATNSLFRTAFHSGHSPERWRHSTSKLLLPHSRTTPQQAASNSPPRQRETSSHHLTALHSTQMLPASRLTTKKLMTAPHPSSRHLATASQPTSGQLMTTTQFKESKSFFPRSIAAGQSKGYTHALHFN